MFLLPLLSGLETDQLQEPIDDTATEAALSRIVRGLCKLGTPYLVLGVGMRLVTVVGHLQDLL